MFSWIKGLITSRYVKSFVRYALAALIAYMVPIPVLTDLATFLQEHADKLTDLITAILVGVLGFWSAGKNSFNAKISKKTNTRVK